MPKKRDDVGACVAAGAAFKKALTLRSGAAAMTNMIALLEHHTPSTPDYAFHKSKRWHQIALLNVRFGDVTSINSCICGPNHDTIVIKANTSLAAWLHWVQRSFFAKCAVTCPKVLCHCT